MENRPNRERERADWDLEYLREMKKIGKSDSGNWRGKMGDMKNSKNIERGKEERNVRAQIERAGLGECQVDRWTENRFLGPGKFEGAGG